MGEKEKEYLPHAVTINEYFEKLEPDELQKVQQKQVYGLICSKTFYDARFQKKWLVIVDGTQTYSGTRKLNDSCLERHYNKGADEETVNYHCDVLEAKIIRGKHQVSLLWTVVFLPFFYIIKMQETLISTHFKHEYLITYCYNKQGGRD